MMRELVAVIKKDLRIAKRDPRFIAPSIIVPFVLLSVYIILWSSFGGGEAFACGLVVQDQTEFGEEMAATIENMKSTTNHTWFSITRYSLEDADSLFQQGSIVGYIIIPSDFGSNISQGLDATVTIYINNINDDIVKNYVHRIEAAVLLYNQNAESPDFDQSQALVAIEEYHALDMTPGNTEYAGAASIVLSLITCTLVGQGLTTAAEYENKAIEDTLNSPISRTTLILGHALSSIPRSLVVFVITYPIVCILLGIAPAGNLLILFVIVVLSILALSPIGELVGILTREKEKALLAGVLLTVIGFLAGGGMAPVSLMPAQFRLISYLMPMTHVISLWTRLFFHDTLSGLLFNSLALIVVWVIFTGIVIVLTGKEVEAR